MLTPPTHYLMTTADEVVAIAFRAELTFLKLKRDVNWLDFTKTPAIRII